MAQGSVKLIVRTLRLHHAEAEVWISVLQETDRPFSRFDGRFVGPHCRYASTVQVAYPVRPLTQPSNAPPNSITKRVVIPEPSMWTPMTPFLYQIALELAESESNPQSLQLTYGLRTAEISRQGISLNGSRFVAVGAAVDDLSEARMDELRGRGLDTLLVKPSDSNIHLWDSADRVGFFLLGKIHDVESLSLAMGLSQHACSLGWLVDPNLVKETSRLAEAVDLPRFGISLSNTTTLDIPDWASFIACEPELLSEFESVDRPKLSLGQADDRATLGSIRALS